MRAPVVLQGHTLMAGATLRPSTMQIKIAADGLSTCTIKDARDGPTCNTNDWIRITTPQGESIVMRVKSVTDDISAGTRTINAEHVFATMRDSVLGENIGWNVEGTVTNKDELDERIEIKDAEPDYIPAVTMLSTIFSKQKTENAYWRLGRCEFNISLPWVFNNGNLYSTLETMLQTLEDPQWELDTSSLPFTASLVRRPTTVQCEMRMNRNISTVNISYDMSTMYTRIYPVGMDELTIGDVNDGVPYLEKNVGNYGLIENVSNNPGCDNADALKQWGAAQLAHNCDPVVTVTVTGRELSAMTGLPMDKLTVGTVCRVPLVKYGTTIAARITSLEWRDAMKDEETVIVTIANEHRTVQGVVKRVQAEIAGVGGGGAKKQMGLDWRMYTYIDRNDRVLWGDFGLLDGKKYYYTGVKQTADAFLHETKLFLTDIHNPDDPPLPDDTDGTNDGKWILQYYSWLRKTADFVGWGVEFKDLATGVQSFITENFDENGGIRAESKIHAGIKETADSSVTTWVQKNDIEGKIQAGIDAKAAIYDHESGTYTVVTKDNLSDTITQSTEIKNTIGGIVQGRIGLTTVTSGGVSKTVAEILADQTKILGALNIDGNQTTLGNTYVAGYIASDGIIQANDGIDVRDGNLVVRNDAEIRGDIDISGTLTAGTFAPSTISTTGRITSGGGLTVNSTNGISSSGSISTDRNISADGTITADGTIYANNGISTSAKSTFGAAVDVNSNLTVSGTLTAGTFAPSSIHTGSVISDGAFTAWGDAGFHGGVYIGANSLYLGTSQVKTEEITIATSFTQASKKYKMLVTSVGGVQTITPRPAETIYFV